MSTGIGVMLHMLGGKREESELIKQSAGKKIKNINKGDDDALHIEFEDGSKIKIFDDGQSCCEKRYMTTDDDLKSFVGAEFIGAKVAECENAQDEYEEHEIQFLNIETSLGVITCETHNIHNGYYGGFWMTCKAE